MWRKEESKNLYETEAKWTSINTHGTAFDCNKNIIVVKSEYMRGK